MQYSCLAALAIRASLIIWSWIQDSYLNVKYTDVDYFVFTDAARYVTQGRSPYDRHTYRYSPLLAWITTPNILLHPDFGKVLFSLLDVLTGILIYGDVASRYGRKEALLSLRLWLFNPITLTVSTRGSAESLIILSVLVTLYFHRRASYFTTGLFLGLAVHLKLYPIIYSIVLYTSAGNRTDTIWESLKPSWNRVKLVLGFLISITCLTAICYWYYDWPFLQETYLHHLTRQDVRHNFSPYFYMLYLSVGQKNLFISLAAFLPQVVIMLVLSARYRSKTDLSWALFALTYGFVSFNKVVTSQYFLWYLSLLPLSLAELGNGSKIGPAIGWFSAQGIWLYFAYRLEFLGEPTFLHIWIAGLAFLTVNIWILCSFIQSRALHFKKLKKN